jgi:hypothetical protein
VPVLQAKKLTMDEYAMNHPAGRIGKRLILKVGDVMKKKDDLPISSADASLMSELVKLSSAGVGCLLVRCRYVVVHGVEVAASHTCARYTRSTQHMELLVSPATQRAMRAHTTHTCGYRRWARCSPVSGRTMRKDGHGCEAVASEKSKGESEGLICRSRMRRAS